MKRCLALGLALALLLPACTPVAEETPLPEETAAGLPGAAAIAQAIVDSQPEPEGYAARAGEELTRCLEEDYGIGELFLLDAAAFTSSGGDGWEVGIFRPASMNNDAGKLTAALEEYRQVRAEKFSTDPERAAQVSEGAVIQGWGCVALLLCGDVDAAAAAFERTAGEVERQPSAGGLTPAETRWLIPFDPPNEYDMSLYDTSAILAAWASGDDSGLTDRDAAILEKCRAILAEQVTEDMTDFEKERNIYSWLTVYGADHMDETVYDPRTPQGQEDNTNPYGVLVRGYGICLGYAATFQLLLELAGVECVTVVGARKESREDHAWNMVRLEGEWYCVDPTLDIAVWKVARQYQYFNVTSTYLRERNLQWDYRSIPEATSERFYWNGTGAPPQ